MESVAMIHSHAQQMCDTEDAAAADVEMTSTEKSRRNLCTTRRRHLYLLVSACFCVKGGTSITLPMGCVCGLSVFSMIVTCFCVSVGTLTALSMSGVWAPLCWIFCMVSHCFCVIGCTSTALSMSAITASHGETPQLTRHTIAQLCAGRPQNNKQTSLN